MAGTMGRLSVGVTGLQTSQYALNATAHNLTNTQTEGYTRQQVLLTDQSYNRVATDSYYINNVGMGVVTAQIRQVRDQFADDTYRTESGRMSYYKAQYETVSEIENYFGELEGKDFNTTLNDMWTSMQELQKESNSIVTRSSFISNALTLIDRVQTIRSSLIEYQRNLNTEIKDQVKTVNDLASTIYELNQQIRAVEAGNVEKANDLKDKRNQALDKLSSIVNSEVVNNEDGTVEVYLEGHTLVTLGRTYTLTTQKVCENEKYQQNYGFTGSSTDFLMPVWEQDGDPLFNINRVPTADSNSDIGSLNGLMMSRGYFISNYTDVPTKPTKPLEKDFANNADYQTAMAQYEQDVKDYVKDLEYFNTYVEPYTITNLEAQFDVLIHADVVSHTGFYVVGKQYLIEAVECGCDRRNLYQYIRTVCILLQHILDASHLSFDPLQPVHQILFFFFLSFFMFPRTTRTILFFFIFFHTSNTPYRYIIYTGRGYLSSSLFDKIFQVSTVCEYTMHIE